MRRCAAILSSCLVATLAAAGSHMAAAAVRDCRSAASPNVVVTSARNMRCGQAAREMARYRGSISRSFRIPGGFRCTRVSGGRLSGTWRCVARPRAFRFRFAD